MIKLSNKIKKAKYLIILSFTLLIIIPTILFNCIIHICSTSIIKKKISINTQESINQLSYQMEKEIIRIQDAMVDISTDQQVCSIISNTDFNKYEYSLLTKRQAIDGKLLKAFSDTIRPNQFYFFPKNQDSGYYYFKEKGDFVNFDVSKWYVQSIEKRGKLLWDSCEKVNDFSDDSIIVSKAVLSTQDFNKIGVMVAVFDKESFINQFIYRSNKHNLYVIDASGEILITYHILKDKKILDFSNGEGIEEKNVDGHNYMIIYSEPVKNNNWRIVKVISEEEIMSELSYISALFYILLGFFGVFFILFLKYIYGTISRPLESIINRIDDVGTKRKKKKSTNKPRCYEVKIIEDEIVQLVKDKENDKQIISEYDYENKKIRLEKLQAQINPHFLYNTLTFIKYKALMSKQLDISHFITALISLMRKSINRDGVLITVKDEIENIKNYNYIQNDIYEGNIRFEYDIDTTLNNRLIPGFLLQPLVENCILHGIDPNSNDGIINIKCYKDHDNIIFEITDNGKGMDDDTIEAVLSIVNHVGKNKERLSNIGIGGINEKIKLIYDESYGLSIESKVGKGTCFTITLPYQYKKA